MLCMLRLRQTCVRIERIVSRLNSNHLNRVLLLYVCLIMLVSPRGRSESSFQSTFVRVLINCKSRKSLISRELPEFKWLYIHLSLRVNPLILFTWCGRVGGCKDYSLVGDSKNPFTWPKYRVVWCVALHSIGRKLFMYSFDVFKYAHRHTPYTMPAALNSSISSQFGY